jgi:hypothetical protein
MNKAERKEYLASLEGVTLSDEEWARELYGSVAPPTSDDTSPFDGDDDTEE